MNIFFQRLLSRFLHDNLTGTRIADEVPIRKLFAYAPDGNPRRRSAPAPPPDYALFRGNTLYAFLDAKYRDIGNGVSRPNGSINFRFTRLPRRAK
jgi:5-methylcytosine-specific restriction enzyme subunit McrC